MEFRLTPEQELMRDSIRRLVARDIDPLIAQHDSNQTLPKSALLAIFGKLADLGLTAARLPEAAGGPGIKMIESMNVLGAMGLSTEARVEALYRDIRMIPIPDGTNEILALIHGRELTGHAAFRGSERSAH